MSVITDFSIAGSDFVLGKALQEAPNVTIEFDRMIPVDNRVMPYFWVIGEDRGRFDAVLEREPELSKFTALDEVDDRTLYRAEWDPSVDTFVQAMVEYDVVLQEASGDADSWQFQLRFPDSAELSAFHAACREADIQADVERLFNPIDPEFEEARTVTDSQRSLIERAYDEGYFEVPRKTTLVELADEVGLSDQAVNERIRRGLSSLVETTIKSGSEE